MGHPAIENRTPFAFEPLFVADEEGRPLLVLVVKATYAIERDAALALADEQLPVCVAGVSWGKPGESSFKYEPEVAWVKPATDVVLLAHAWAPGARTSVLDVGFRVGPVQKNARVFGERVWFKHLSSVSSTQPLPFERVPLVYERAFGGWDRSHADATRHTFEARNPVGRGYRGKGGSFEEGLRLPNVEDLAHPLKGLHDHPAPVGFGFTCPDWQPRPGLAGTYDEAWSKERAPLLPKDFDRRFFNAASAGLVAPGHLRGDELVSGVGVTRSGRLSFRLPGQPPPALRVQRRGAGDASPEARLDTVVVNTDDGVVVLIWRAQVLLRQGPHEVLGVRVGAPGARPARTAS